VELNGIRYGEKENSVPYIFARVNGISIEFLGKILIQKPQIKNNYHEIYH